MDTTSMNFYKSAYISPSKTMDPPTSPNISRYGRTHKPKMQDDYVSTDKKVSAYLKLSPGNQIQYFSPVEPKKKPSPKKSDDNNSPRRGRPPKFPKDLKNENVLKMEIKLEPQDPNSPVEGCEWMVGDLAWARVGGHPFWPCIIALDPVQKIFTKLVRKGRTTVSQRWVHVQFFGDNGRRSWLNSTAIMCYNGRDAFIQLGDTILAGMRKKEPKQTSAFVIKPAVIQVWEKAVQEAEDVVNVSREERIAFFTRNFPPEPVHQLTRDELIEEVLESSQSPSAKRGRKRKAEQSPLEEEIKKKQIKLEEKKELSEPIDPLLSSTPRTIADRKKRQALLMQLARSNQTPTNNTSPSTLSSAAVKEEPINPTTPQPLKRPISTEPTAVTEEKKPKRKYLKKKLAPDYQAFCSKHFDRVSDDHPELNEKDINKYLQKMWNEMDETQKSKYRSRLGSQEKEESESAEETPEDVELEEVEEELRSCSPAPLAMATQKPTATKRNNIKCLFSGAKSEKVCQICERTGDTQRCRGPCQGYYHPDCISNPPVFNQTATPTSAKKGKKRGRPKKMLVESPLLADKNDPEEQNENDRLPLKEEDAKETEEKVELNGIVGKTDDADIVEVIEPEVKTGKVRKGSKDSESGSSEEGEGFRCKDCQKGRSQPCFVCHEYIHKKSGEAKLYRCITAYCGKVYHEVCLKPWPQTSWRSNGSDRGVLTCPQHTCHTCASDNPGVIKARYSNDKLVRCVRCPTTYHYGNYCLPAGSEILTNTQIICPQHYQPPKKTLIQHVNAAWCFICASGGSLICCDLCPTSFHADCLNISTPPDGSYVCEDCQTGRFPLYGEIVWVKLGTYRWWPAEILYPAFIPDNILNLPHVRGEFAVKFFGSHDHYWVNRGRVFLYQDGDTAGKGNYKKSSVDNVFERAVREASEAQRKYLEMKATRDAETRPGMKPPNYVKLKTNRPVGNVRTMDLNVSSLTPCECDPKSEAPCAPDSDCLNRILMVECHPSVCPAGEKCRNQLFEKRQYPPLQPYHTQGRGWGLKTLVPLKKGDFVIEYVGEMIDEEEYKKRLVQMHANNEENYYFLTIDKDRMLDAGPKGNVARFMNHSCQPNCETQKWTVNGDTRVGLFALYDIPAGTELVFNYNLESIGSDKKPCMCGAPNCSGFIGVKASKNQDKEETKEKKTVKKKRTAVVSKAHEEECFICGEGGELLLCDGKHCTKGYHLTCLGKKQRPQGYWLCPWHQCNTCNKGRVRRCTFCVNSYCQEHSDGNIRLDSVKGLLCSKHDQENVDASCKESKPDESTPMEIDEEINENSSTVPRPNAVDSSIQIESTNNNIIKTVTPGRRSQRSKSDTPRTEKILSGSLQKVTKRKARPSSIDDKLIVSDNKTEQICANSLIQESKGTDSHKDVEELLNEIFNTLPLDETVKKETEKIAQLEEEPNIEPSKEVVPEIRDNVSHNQSILNGVPKDSNDVNDTEKANDESSEPCKSHSKEENNFNELTNGLDNAEKENNKLDLIKSNSDAIGISLSPVKDATEEKEDTTNVNMGNVLQNNSLNLNGTVDDLQDITKSDSDSNKIEQVFIKANCVSEQSDNHSVSEKTCTLSVQENVATEVDYFSGNKEKIVSDKEKKLSEKSNSEKDNLVECSEEENKEKEIDSKRPEIRSSSINKSKGEDERDKQTFTSSSVLDVDDHVDDFELSYSEYSNDKLYKSINHSESSLEMKLTDCTSSENSESEQIANKIEQISSKKELVSCIEQSSAMEVA